MSNLNLNEVRVRIDEVDKEIQTLLSRRAELALEVAKAKYTEEDNPTFYRPEREAEVLRQVMQRNQSPLSDKSVGLLFREIMSACLALQKPLTVAFLGPEGTFSQAAVTKQFGHAVEAIPMQTIDEVFREVEAEKCQYGVVPIENSTEGGVNQTLDCFVNSPLKICAEVALPIHHHLLSTESHLSDVKRIYSHQQSLAQCYSWLKMNLPMVERIAVNSNAEAAKRAASEKNTAAIAGKTAAEIYQLNVLVSRIEDNVNNTTRFAVLGQQDVPPTGKDKTSFLLATTNKPGSLFQVLKIFADKNINMTRIESRPSRQGMWEYVFFVDIDGHIQDNNINQAVSILKDYASLIKHLGSYPDAVL